MLSDEEKKEYEELKRLLFTGTISQYGKRKLIDIIEKQSKEIEELKEKNNKLMEELDLTTVYISGVYDGEKKVEGKIKAKIEEEKECGSVDGTNEMIIEVLQSLLEKE